MSPGHFSDIWWTFSEILHVQKMSPGHVRPSLGHFLDMFKQAHQKRPLTFKSDFLKNHVWAASRITALAKKKANTNKIKTTTNKNEHKQRQHQARHEQKQRQRQANTHSMISTKIRSEKTFAIRGDHLNALIGFTFFEVRRNERW